MNRDRIKSLLSAGTVALACLTGAPQQARAEVSELRISKGFGILYLPMIVMQERRLVEARAASAGLGDIKVTWLLFDGGNVINDAMLSGALDIAGTGAPGFVTLWAKAKASPKTEVVGVSGMSGTALWLNTVNANVKSLRDFSDKDRIALPGIKTSLSAVVLQMAVAKEFGRENYAKLDTQTVGLSHPDALAALLSGRSEITAHFTSPPFSYIEAQNPRVHRVLNSVETLGPITLDVTFAPKRFTDANPKLTTAFIEAMDDACAFIARDKPAAAAIFAKASPVKVDEADVLKMLEDPDTRFSATPTGVTAFSDFLSEAGLIKLKPASWRDLFVPALQTRAGS